MKELIRNLVICFVFVCLNLLVQPIFGETIYQENFEGAEYKVGLPASGVKGWVDTLHVTGPFEGAEIADTPLMEGKYLKVWNRLDDIGNVGSIAKYLEKSIREGLVTLSFDYIAGYRGPLLPASGPYVGIGNEGLITYLNFYGASLHLYTEPPEIKSVIGDIQFENKVSPVMTMVFVVDMDEQKFELTVSDKKTGSIIFRGEKIPFFKKTNVFDMVVTLIGAHGGGINDRFIGIDNIKAEHTGKPHAKEKAALTGKEVVQNYPTGQKKRILFVTDQWPGLAVPCEQTRKLLKEKGFEFYSKGNWDGMTLDFLNKFDVVFLGCTFPKISVNTGGGDEKTRQNFNNLLIYLQNGGSIFMVHAGDQEMGMGVLAQNEFLKPLGAEILLETVADRNQGNQYKKELSKNYFSFFNTTQILPSPVSNGVKGLNYINYAGGAGSTLQNPIKVNDAWTAVVKGEKTAYSLKVGTGGSRGEIQGPGTYSEYPALVAIRQYGEGRIALWPMNPGFTYLDGYHPILDNGIVMNSSFGDGKVSNGETLFYNILGWFTQNTPKIGRKTLNSEDLTLVKSSAPTTDAAVKKYEWENVNLDRPYPNIYKGLIGAVSNLSAGEGEPEEFIKAAKKAGYSFIVFAEDFAKLDREKWEKLRTICQKNTNETFLACPGFRYLDEVGDTYLMFKEDLPWPQDEWRSKKYLDRLIWSGTIVYANFSTPVGWPPNAVIKAQSNPKPSFFLGHYKGFAVYTYENGKLTDDSYDTYLKLQKNTYDLFPIAVHLVKNPIEIEKASQNGYQTYVMGHKVQEVIGTMSGIWGYEVSWWNFISEGPIIENFRAYNPMWADMAHFGKNADRMRVRIEVSSPAGLKEVRLLDGDKIMRRWLVSGQKTFWKEIDFFHDRQHQFLVEAVDVNGGKAISADKWTYVEDYSLGMCRDNWNTMRQGKFAELSIKPINGFENGIPQNGMGSVMPKIIARDRDCLMRPAIYQIIQSGGRFGGILESISYGGYDPSVPAAYHVQHFPDAIYPIGSYSFDFKSYEFMSRPNYPSIVMYEGQVDIKKDLKLVENKSFGSYPPIQFAVTSPTRPQVSNVAICKSGKVTTKNILNEKEWEESLNEGDYITLYPSVGGSLSIISMMKGLRCYAALDGGGSPIVTVGLDIAEYYVKVGEKFPFQFLAVRGAVGLEDNTPKTAEWVASSMGLSKEAAYQVKPSIGEVKSIKYVLNLKAVNGVFDGKITQADLPIELPVLLEGLNERWDAGLWYKGKNKICVVERNIDQFSTYHTSEVFKELEDLIVRVPVLNDSAFCQIDINGGNRDIFVGHFAVCDNAEIFIHFSDLRKGYARVEAHNPTDSPITCTIKRAESFVLIPSFEKKITLKPGSSEIFEVR